MPAARNAALVVCTTVAATGVLVMAAGSFLPWFRSGTVSRNSYQASGLLDRLEFFDNPLITAGLRVWIGFPLLAAVCLALYALQRPRIGAAVTLALALLVGTVSLIVTAKQNDSGGTVAIVTTGPLTTGMGAVIAVAAALGVFVAAARRARTTVNTGGVRA